MPTHAPSPSAAALSAFLRGIERRARVFAQAQSGSAEVAEAATAMAIETFRQHAGQLPLRQWPLRFWAELLAVPALTRSEAPPSTMPALQPLYRLAPGPRAALLLRAAKERLEDVAESAESGCPAEAARPAEVVLLTLLRVAQHVISVRDLLEPLGGVSTRVDVGV